MQGFHLHVADCTPRLCVCVRAFFILGVPALILKTLDFHWSGNTDTILNSNSLAMHISIFYEEQVHFKKVWWILQSSRKVYKCLNKSMSLLLWECLVWNFWTSSLDKVLPVIEIGGGFQFPKILTLLLFYIYIWRNIPQVEHIMGAHIRRNSKQQNFMNIKVKWVCKNSYPRNWDQISQHYHVATKANSRLVRTTNKLQNAIFPDKTCH